MSPGSRRALLAVLALLTVAGVTAIGAAAATGPTADYAQQDASPNGTNESATEIKVALQSNGDARWTITEHFDVSTAHERAAFEELASRFESGQSAQLGLPAFREALDRVEPTVDRPMNIEGVTRTTSLENGTMTLSFTWTSFARENDGTRIVGDAFTTAEGTWLNGLGPGQSLIIELPRGSAIDTPKKVTDGTIRWDGPTSFDRGYLQISYTANPQSLVPPLLWGVLVALLVFAAVGVVGGYLLTRRREGFSLPEVPIGGSGSPDDAPATRGSAADPTPPDTEGGADADDADGDGDEDEDGVDVSLLSDEERVEYLIEENGGRMKQANIVKETGWSNAKVSQLLSSMEEEGRIAKLRIGRENLISFPDEDIGEFEDS